jgi:hypothetical protein
MDKTKPYLDEDGTLVIPFECGDHTYKYWKQEGRSLADILAELGTGEEVWDSYTHVPYSAASAVPDGADPEREPEANAGNAPALPATSAAPEATASPASPASPEADLAQPPAMA